MKTIQRGNQPGPEYAIFPGDKALKLPVFGEKDAIGQRFMRSESARMSLLVFAITY